MKELYNGQCLEIIHRGMKYLPYVSLADLTSLIGSVVINKHTDSRCLVVKVDKFSVPSEYLSLISCSSTEYERFGTYGITLGDGSTVDAQTLLREFTSVNGMPLGIVDSNTESSYLDDPAKYSDLPNKYVGSESKGGRIAP
jgi:hypothetical protein